MVGLNHQQCKTMFTERFRLLQSLQVKNQNFNISTGKSESESESEQFTGETPN